MTFCSASLVKELTRMVRGQSRKLNPKAGFSPVWFILLFEEPGLGLGLHCMLVK